MPKLPKLINFLCEFYSADYSNITRTFVETRTNRKTTWGNTREVRSYTAERICYNFLLMLRSMYAPLYFVDFPECMKRNYRINYCFLYYRASYLQVFKF